jgi:hypothetical protein
VAPNVGLNADEPYQREHTTDNNSSESRQRGKNVVVIRQTSSFKHPQQARDKSSVLQATTEDSRTGYKPGKYEQRDKVTKYKAYHVGLEPSEQAKKFQQR